ncbi:ribonuclease P protein subunit p29 isoform X1 [Cephus cinctus]|uniref:Ribonuclease P protein subunit p29 n=1 Tax=Cephus cinctus TaxID=211228 RepID=A0AAJ7W7J1_CEPCN|nr:ribonuclease P protein subunit p29 isoform X1 [Cephus cinctus]
MDTKAHNVCTPLPFKITNKACTSENREKYLLKFLEQTLPQSDIKAISDELKRTFLFDKHRTKRIRHKPKKRKFLTTRKRILLGINKITRNSALKYVDMVPLNKMWLDYMKHMLDVKNFAALPDNPIDVHWDNVSQKLLKADFHGAIITISRSKCPSLVGITGIIIQDTKGTFRVLGKDNIIRTIPKEVVVFDIYMESTTLQLFGRELCTRPAERSVKKFKTTRIADL